MWFNRIPIRQRGGRLFSLLRSGSVMNFPICLSTRILHLPFTGRLIVEVRRVVLEKGRSKIQATSLHGWTKMKLIVVLLIAGFLTWKLSPDFQTWVSSKLSLVKATSAFGPALAVAPSGFKCDGRKYCSQMTSCSEAKTFLNNCPGMQMDGDNDGVPCERQWCH